MDALQEKKDANLRETICKGKNKSIPVTGRGGP
jgi:hypothetical protein